MKSYPANIPKEELKNKVAQDFFNAFDNTQIIEKIDFCIAPNKPLNISPFLWAKAKKGNKADINESFVQLILTIGKSRIHTKYLPPIYLGAFDCEKIAFMPYSEILNVFSQNDFNWNVTPSDHKTKEFQHIYKLCKSIIDNHKYIFYFTRDQQELKDFIKQNFKDTGEISQIQIDKNNFLNIYLKWRDEVKPSISIDWNSAKIEDGIVDADFYLADLLSQDNQTIWKNLFVVLEYNTYKFNKKKSRFGSLNIDTASFNDNQAAHYRFWRIYKRPPAQEYWDYIIKRRNLLVPQDIRERKGSFFTPRIWVEKSQEYITKALGDDWQDEFVVWDCAAGTGNLLAGLSNTRNIFASSLDKADVEAIKERIRNGANLLEDNVFQFDFLNDDFFDKPCEKHKNNVNKHCKECQKSKLPQTLQKILNNKNKRKKLLIYINPPYAEASSATTPMGTGTNKSGVALGNNTYLRYKDSIKNASNELFAQFFIRIYKEIPHCYLASFSTLKYINSSNFATFRTIFKAQFLAGFICPAYTFDNVKGTFPIGFLVWNLGVNKEIKMIKLDIFNNRFFCGKKRFYNHDNKKKSINKWIKNFSTNDEKIGIFMADSPDFQNNKHVGFISKTTKGHWIFTNITASNLIPFSVYFAVRHAINATWLNDRDQFLMPKKAWERDYEFQTNCLAFSLFHTQNRITSNISTNHFIPFSEKEIGAKARFASDFLVSFINGKIKLEDAQKRQDRNLIKTTNFIPTKKLSFSDEATAVFNAGREIFRYYHAQDFSTKRYNPNASLYDIKEFFQGRNQKDIMNPPSKCNDEYYKNLIANLSNALSILANECIAPKIYQYGFLMK